MRKRLKGKVLACCLAMVLAVNMVPVLTYAQETDSVSSAADGSANPDGDLNGNMNGNTGDSGDQKNQIEDKNQENPDVTDQDETESDKNQGEAPAIEDGDKAEDKEEDKDKDEDKPQEKEGALITYSGHVQTYGNRKTVKDGEILGTTGKAKRLEAVKISKGPALADFKGDIVYRVHVQSYGTQGWKKNGQQAGTTGKAKRMEAIQVYLTGDLAEQYDIYYSMHVQTGGWTKWTKGSSDASGWCGTSGLAKRAEAIKIRMVKKDGGTVPDEGGTFTYLTQNSFGNVNYSGTQESFGVLNTVSNGAALGVTGKAKRLEKLNITLSDGAVSGSVSYRAHVQTTGWQGWISDGGTAGVDGKRLEAIQIKLTGEISKYCDVWYRTHIQSYGWLGWAKNGQNSGSSGLSKRVEAIQIKIVPKGSKAPGSNSGYYVTESAQQRRVNAAVQNVYRQAGKNLYSCYAWCVNHIRYVSLGYSVPAGYTHTQWYALYGLESHYGDCRTFAAAFYQLAKGMGYNARYVYGYVPNRSGGMIDHAWVEITMGGTTYVFDPDFQYETGRNGYQIRYGMSGTWRYTNYRYLN